MKVAVIGGGAAGFFAAIAVKNNHPEAEVSIFEKSQKLLSKVKVSGGGRCNVTNATKSIKTLAAAYPRGGNALKKAFKIFSTEDTMEWFESRGVALVIQDDLHVFPVSQDSQSIIDCFMKEAKMLQIKIETGAGVKDLVSINDQWELHFIKEHLKTQIFNKVIIATGGSPKRSGLVWLEKLGHKIEEPVPSLFTFNMPSESIKELMGIVVENATTKIEGTGLKAQGPLLITHWGMSGPAIIVLSAFGARILEERSYSFNVHINWVSIKNEETVFNDLKAVSQSHPKKQLSNFRPYALPDRLWQYFLNKCDFPAHKLWGELGKKGLHKIVRTLTHDIYKVEGKTTFKEEFVTCGGVSLESINFQTMESTVTKNIYFAGEVMDIDGITGGFNFQSAWTTAFIAGKLA